MYFNIKVFSITQTYVGFKIIEHQHKEHSVVDLNSNTEANLRKDDLGFYYSRDDKNCCWIITGSQEGILEFCDLLEGYSTDKSREAVSEDTHYGPYSYLKFMTWDKPEIVERKICGRLSDFKKLSDIIKNNLEKLNGDFEIDNEYSNDNEYSIKFVLKGDDFEPASMDPNL